jgi:hypothetical protein
MTFFYALIIEYALQGHTLQARMYLDSSKACSNALVAAEALSDTLPADLYCENTGKLSGSIRPKLRPQTLKTEEENP